MPPVPLRRPADVAGVFEKLGWWVVRRRGSHIILTRTGSVATLSVPDHPRERRPLEAGIAILGPLNRWSGGVGPKAPTSCSYQKPAVNRPTASPQIP